MRSKFSRFSVSYMEQESPQDDFNWAANFPGERVVSTLSEPFHREFYRESKRKLIKANFISS